MRKFGMGAGQKIHNIEEIVYGHNPIGKTQCGEEIMIGTVTEDVDDITNAIMFCSRCEIFEDVKELDADE